MTHLEPNDRETIEDVLAIARCVSPNALTRWQQRQIEKAQALVAKAKAALEERCERMVGR